ncbi:PH domain-containing protein [Streptomyces sp. NPDC005329]|uniref:PH domain-containing protein n=1 Tax=Streptomyces sp. NPDC005329 TaxID=3157034 RepID=UPI0033B733A7
MYRIDAWWDRRLAGLLMVLAAGTSVVLALTSDAGLTVVRVFVVLAIFCVVFWFARMTFVPFVEVGPAALRVRNIFETHEIPWRAMREVRDDPRSGVAVVLEDEQKVRIEAFARWPSFGRHQKIVERLEQARREALEGGDTSVTVVKSSGIAEFILFIPIAGAVVSLVVQGIWNLLS